jgi:hypothetical protein
MDRKQVPSGTRLLIRIVLAVFCVWAAGVPAKANLVQNGSFEITDLSSPGGYFCQTGLTCVSNVTDWTSNCNIFLFIFGCGTNTTELSVLFPNTDGFAYNGNTGLGGTIANSPDGGNFVADDGEVGFGAPFWQTINGLVPGTLYTLSFDQAAAQQLGSSGPTTEQWEVTFGSSTQDSALMSTPSQGFSPWNLQTMTFEATSTSEVLTFLAVGTPYGAPPVSLIDGISLTPTPEPSSLYLAFTTVLILGFGANYKVRRKRRS